MWYIIGMKKFLKDIAQGVYDGLQENEGTHNQYSFQDIYDVIQEFVSYIFVGMILSVGAIFAYPYYKAFISLGAILKIQTPINTITIEFNNQVFIVLGSL